MADTKPTKAKRLVKNPETFRERAVKAGEAGDKPTRSETVKKAGGSLFSPLTSPLRRIGNFKPVRLVGKVIVPPYVRNSWKELKLVTWPTWKESRQLTFAVLVFAIIFGAVIALVDFGLDKIFRNILLK